MEYNFSTKYHSSKKNNLKDILSRYYEGTVKVGTINEKRTNLEWKAEKREHKFK
jgi:hypothetical protein